jgi:ectoine hydroxylase-related dioxygenase (phytanoyl-CoA dioxygenase family)|tara:strand:- start:266 stop:1030 length:765 start_codon:yes stop_codon:yes gene_type:complete
MNFKEFDYLFDLNGYYHLKNVIKKDDINYANKKIRTIENLDPSKLPHNVFFGKKKNNKELYISNILEIDKIFEKFALLPIFSKLIKRVTGNSNFFRLNHAVAMTKLKKNSYTYLHMGNIPHHPKVFYFVKNGKIFSNITKIFIPLCNNTNEDGGFAVIPGSHKSNFLRPYDNNPKNNKSCLVHLDVKPGDAVIFTEALAHGSMVNKSNRIRRILSYMYTVKYMPDWTKLKLNYSEKYKATAPQKIKNLIQLKSD